MRGADKTAEGRLGTRGHSEAPAWRALNQHSSHPRAPWGAGGPPKRPPLRTASPKPPPPATVRRRRKPSWEMLQLPEHVQPPEKWPKTQQHLAGKEGGGKKKRFWSSPATFKPRGSIPVGRPSCPRPEQSHSSRAVLPAGRWVPRGWKQTAGPVQRVPGADGSADSSPRRPSCLPALTINRGSAARPAPSPAPSRGAPEGALAPLGGSLGAPVTCTGQDEGTAGDLHGGGGAASGVKAASPDFKLKIKN